MTQKNVLKQNRIEMQEKNILDLKEVISIRETEIEELKIHQKVFFEEMKRKESEIRLVEKQLEEFRTRLAHD